jgi:Rod binding domain-containing protein
MDPAATINSAQTNLETARAARLGTIAKGASNDAQAKKAGDEFEAFFISTMMESMFAGIKTDGPFGGGQGEKVFRSLLLQEYGKTVAGRDGFGISDMVQQEILKLQEAQTK